MVSAFNHGMPRVKFVMQHNLTVSGGWTSQACGPLTTPAPQVEIFSSKTVRMILCLYLDFRLYVLFLFLFLLF